MMKLRNSAVGSMVRNGETEAEDAPEMVMSAPVVLVSVAKNCSVSPGAPVNVVVRKSTWTAAACAAPPKTAASISVERQCLVMVFSIRYGKFTSTDMDQFPATVVGDAA